MITKCVCVRACAHVHTHIYIFMRKTLVMLENHRSNVFIMDTEEEMLICLWWGWEGCYFLITVEF